MELLINRYPDRLLLGGKGEVAPATQSSHPMASDMYVPLMPGLGLADRVASR